VNQALYLSIATVALGGIGYAALPGLRRLLARLRPLAGAGPEKAYERGLAGLLDGARRASDVLAGASLRHTQAVAFSVLVAAVGTTLWLKGGPAGGPAVTGVDLSISFHEGLLAGVVGAAAVVAAAARAPLVSLTSLGVVGIGLALLFVVIGAPDLAMTQVLVEILAVVIALGVLQGVVAPRPAEPPRHRAGAALLGLGVGATVALLVLAVLAVPPSTAVADYFVRESVPGGFGRNVVNVILVDFRALDTLGEITVLAVAALGAFALLASARPRGTGPGPRGARSVVLQAGARLLLALLLLASLFMLWRGHNEPGGGFIGGLFASAAVVLYLLAFRQGATERLMRAAPQSALTAGLAVAVASGLLAAARAGLPFLTGQWVEVGELKLGTPLLFDLGVFLVVVGFTLTIVLSIERVAVPPAFAGAPSPLPPRANGDAPASKAGATRRAVRAPSRS
jgi:multicomponent Na+:H+ antiporter subunit A